MPRAINSSHAIRPADSLTGGCATGTTPLRVLREPIQAACSAEQHHHFVGMRDIEVAAQQLAGKIRVGMARIEQVDAVPELVPLGAQAGDLGLAQLQRVLVLAPGKYAARPRQGEAAHDEQASQGYTLCQALTRQFPIAAKTFHRCH